MSEGYEVQDSGDRRTFGTGAQRDRAHGKGRYDLLQPFAMERVAVILEAGARKYDARNWEKGMPLSNYVDSALRHIFQGLRGMTDEDHWGQALWNLMSLVDTQERIERGVLPEELNDLPFT